MPKSLSPTRQQSPHSLPVVVDTQTFAVRVEGRPVSLTAVQFDLFKLLFDNRDRVVGHAEIAREILGRIAGDSAQVVRVHICHLRQAVGALRCSIVTVRRRGYRLTLTVGNDVERD
jgi:DNA-binding response OmpR family regulator